MHGWELALKTCVKQKNVDLFKSQASEMADIDLLNKIDEIYAKNYLSKILESKLLKYFTVSHLQIQKKKPMAFISIYR